MALIVPPGYAHVILPMDHTLSGQDAVVTWGIDMAAFAGTDSAAADAAFTAFQQNMGGVIDTNVLMGPVELIVGQDGTENTTASGATIAAGGRSETSVPPQVAVLYTKTTARGGRRGRGRMFVPWAVGTANVGESGTIGSTYVTTLLNAGNAFRAALATALIPMVVLHSEGASTPGPPNAVTVLTPSSLVATQRRRVGR